MEKIIVRVHYCEFNHGVDEVNYYLTTRKGFHDKCRAFKKLCRQHQAGVYLPRIYDEEILEHTPDTFVIRDGSYRMTSQVVRLLNR